MPPPSKAQRAMAAYAWPSDPVLLAEIARGEGVTVAELEALRAAVLGRREDIRAESLLEAHAVMRRARELAAVRGYKGSLVSLIVRALDAAIERAEKHKSAGEGRSAGHTKSRSRAPAEAREGTSEVREPRLPVSRGTGWVRDRRGHGSTAVPVKADG